MLDGRLAQFLARFASTFVSGSPYFWLLKSVYIIHSLVNIINPPNPLPILLRVYCVPYRPNQGACMYTCCSDLPEPQPGPQPRIRVILNPELYSNL
jgi:hypothetical protein